MQQAKASVRPALDAARPESAGKGAGMRFRIGKVGGARWPPPPVLAKKNSARVFPSGQPALKKISEEKASEASSPSVSSKAARVSVSQSKEEATKASGSTSKEDTRAHSATSGIRKTEELRESRREDKALRAAKLNQSIQQELLERLQKARARNNLLSSADRT